MARKSSRPVHVTHPKRGSTTIFNPNTGVRMTVEAPSFNIDRHVPSTAPDWATEMGIKPVPFGTRLNIPTSCIKD